MCKLSPFFFKAVDISRGTELIDYSSLTDIDKKALQEIKSRQTIRQKKIEYRKRLWWDDAMEKRRIDTMTTS